MPIVVRCPSEEPLRALIESFATALDVPLSDPSALVQQALGLSTPNLERLLGGQREGAPWRRRKDDVYHHRTLGKAISESKAVLYTVAVLDALGVFIEVAEEFYEKLDVPLDVGRRDDEATVEDDPLFRTLDLEGHARQWVAASLQVWDEFLHGLEELHHNGFVRLSISADRLASRDLRLSLAKFVQALAEHRSQRSKAAARSRSTGRPRPDGLKATGRVGYPASALCTCLSEVMKRAGIVDGVSPALAAERVRRAVETEVLHGILEARLVSTHAFTQFEHRARLARYASLPILSSSSPLYPPTEVRALPRTSVVVPVSLVSTYVLLEFVRTHWCAPLDIILLDTASAIPLLATLEQGAHELAVVPRSFVEWLNDHGVGRGYVPLTTLGRGSHGMVVSPASSSAIHEIGARKLDILCIGQKTSRRFLEDLARLRLLDENKLSTYSRDPGTGIMMSASAEALAEKAAVVAFFPMNALITAVGAGQIVPLDRLEESTSSHVLLCRLDRASDTRWAELVVRILHSARECLAAEPRYFRTTVEDVIASKRFMDAFIQCLKN
jgi:hypothetical protein